LQRARQVGHIRDTVEPVVPEPPPNRDIPVEFDWVPVQIEERDRLPRGEVTMHSSAIFQPLHGKAPIYSLQFPCPASASRPWTRHRLKSKVFATFETMVQSFGRTPVVVPSLPDQDEEEALQAGAFLQPCNGRNLLPG